MSSLLIKNGTLATDQGTQKADLLIVDEKIHSTGRNLGAAAGVTPDREIDAHGCFVFPGGIDPHTHMDLPVSGTSASDSFETGTIAALHGGTTTIIDFANQIRGHSLREAIEHWHQLADGKAMCDYAFHVSVTDFNENTRKELQDCVRKHGITSFKTFMAYKASLMIDDRQMIELMEEVKKLGGIVLTHAENGDVIDSLVAKNRAAGNLAPKYHALSHPAISEAEATGRIIDLAYQTGCPLYIVHMSSGEALARAWHMDDFHPGMHAPKIYLETCTQYLLLDQSLYSLPGFEGAKYVMSPPLRGERDRYALWEELSRGLVKTVATDHCPFKMTQKEAGKNDFSLIPNGAPGVEHRMELLYSEGVEKGQISLEQFVALTSSNAARIFGLYPKKGTLEPGADADVVVFDPQVPHIISASSHHMNVDYSAYEGWKVKGRCRTTILRGHVAVEQGKLCLSKGFGKYLPRYSQTP